MLRTPTVRTRRRALACTVLAVAALFSLSGCFRIDMAMTIHSNDTVDGTIIMGIDKSVLSMAGSTVDDVFTNDAMGDKDTKAEPWSDGDLVGKKYTFANQPISEFNSSKDGQGQDNSGKLTINHVNDTYVVDGTLDLTSSKDGSSDPTGSAMLASGKVQIAFTFPGAVLDTNGQLDGKTNTVTWTLQDPTKPLVVHAVSKDKDGFVLAPWMLYGGGGAVLLVIVGIVLAVVLTRRRRAAVAYPAAPQYTPAPYAGPQTFMPYGQNGPSTPQPPAPGGPQQP